MRVVTARRRAVVVAVCLSLAASLTGCRGTGGPAAQASSGYGTSKDGAAWSNPMASAFLATYVRPDGRVTRLDQGNDTVSEGQAYGLLLAEATGGADLVKRIWRWTQVHLQLGDGLFAYHANAAGQVLSPDPASDADVLIAWALLRYRGSGAGALHRAGRQVADAVLANEVTDEPGGVPILTAGPWATGRPATLDPSYWSLPAFTGLARLTGDREWQQLADSAVRLTRRLTDGGRLLPPDWAELTDDGQVLAVPAPDGSQRLPQYGLDAQRTVAWFASSCDPQTRALAARWWGLLRPGTRSRALSLQLDGTALDSTRAVLPLVAAATAAHSAGDDAAGATLSHLADEQQRQHPGYYGCAWAALGPALIETQVLSGC